MGKLHDVIIAGAGPVGLFLACELALARISVLILERDLKPESPWKVFPLGRRGINTQSVENFYRRGLMDKLFEPGRRASSFQKTPGFQFGGHFAGIELNVNKINLDNWKYRLNGPALAPAATTVDRIETPLIERAESLGVTIVRGSGVTGIAAQDDDSVTVEAGEGQSFRGRWLVGCDGGRSRVRKAAGFKFVGTEPRFTGYLVECDFDYPERLKPGFHPTANGMYIVAQDSLYLLDFDGGAFDRTQEITKEHVQDVLDRVTGITDVKITKIHLASTFTDRAKQTTSYRKGRVLVAGDAAHIHSPLGAQGLNAGLGDAMNLGWKLAATVRQEAEAKSKSARTPADLALLDTYESERHPVGKWVLGWTRAQCATLQPDLHGAAMQTLIRDLIATTDGTSLFLDRVWGLSQRYELGDAHPVIGCSVPDFELDDGSRLGPKLESGRGLLISFEDDAALRGLVVGGDDGKYGARVDYLAVDVKDRLGLTALLIRPDGVVAWVAEEKVKPDVDAAKAAVERWFGF